MATKIAKVCCKSVDLLLAEFFFFFIVCIFYFFIWRLSSFFVDLEIQICLLLLVFFFWPLFCLMNCNCLSKNAWQPLVGVCRFVHIFFFVLSERKLIPLAGFLSLSIFFIKGWWTFYHINVFLLSFLFIFCLWLLNLLFLLLFRSFMIIFLKRTLV